MNRLIIGAIGIAAIVFAVFSLRPPSAELEPRMDDFIAALRLGGPEKARRYLTRDFAESVSDADLVAFSNSAGLSGAYEATWTRELIGRDNLGLLFGQIKSGDDAKRVAPLRIVFAREKKTWKIRTIGVEAAGLQPSAKAGTVPTTDALVGRVNQVFAKFDESVERGDMRPLWLIGSHVWRGQFSVEKLDAAYAPFLAKKVRFSALKKYGPVFTSEAKLLDNGVLEVRGYYPTKPDRVYFHQRFVYEGLDWKLAGFAVEVRPDKPSS